MPQIEEAKLKELMIRSLNGDQDAYKTLLQEFIIILEKYFQKKVQNPSDIDDLIQETLISIHKARHTYDSKLSLLSWAYSIAYCRYIDFIRKTSKIKKNEVQFETFPEDITNKEKDMNYLYEEKNRMESVLNKLSEKERKIFTLLKIEKFSIREVSKKMEMSESALKVAAHRIYKKIRKLINQEDL